MGRKIPGKKHRGVKDPEAQRAKREEAVKTKVSTEWDFHSSTFLTIKTKNDHSLFEPP